MDFVIALTLFAFAATLIGYSLATSGADEPAYLPGDVPNKLPQPGARDRYALTGALGSAPVPSWG
jgi:hypothetical protein